MDPRLRLAGAPLPWVIQPSPHENLMSYKILSIAQQDFLCIAAIKNYLRISHNYDDQWIIELISGAISAAENFLRIRLLATKLQIHMRYSCKSTIVLPLIPVAEILEIAVHSGVYDTKLQKNEYYVEKSTIRLRNLPLYEYLTVDYIAGYLDQAQIPASIKQGMFLHIAEMYDSRGTTISISEEVRKLYQPYRKMML